jgi:cation diffusion facilitator family transporter
MSEKESSYSTVQTTENRDRVIVRTSVIGILANLFLAAFKAAVGLLSHSIAVVLDAVNNLSDALSSVITIIGTKLAGKKPDKKHPLGYGRIEYLSALIVSAFVLYAGITSLVESVKKIIHPEAADYSAAGLVIIASAVIVKLLLGRYVKATGEKVNSGALIASGSDAVSDAALSLSVFISAVIFMVTGFSLEAYVGVVIAVFIIRAGLEMMMETLDDILGKRADRELVKAVKKTVISVPGVRGAYDLFIHNYGPEQQVASIHVEVPDTMTADEIDEMERRIAYEVYKEHGVILTGIGIYSVNTRDDKIREMRRTIGRLVTSHDGVLQMHGFYVDQEKKRISFDVIIDYALMDRESLFEHIRGDVQKEYPDYELSMTLDIDV